MTGRWFSPGPPVSSTNKTDRHDIAEILLNVALSTIKQTNKPFKYTIYNGILYMLFVILIFKNCLDIIYDILKMYFFFVITLLEYVPLETFF